MANDPNHPESWLETSATGMLIYGLARGVNEGWLDAGFANNSRQGWKALQAKVTPDGDLLDVCGDRAPATEQAPNEKLLKVNHYQKNPGSLSRKQKKRGQFTQRGKSLCTKRLKNMKSTTAPHDVSPVSLKDHCNPTRVISGLVFLAVLTLAFDVAQASDQIELVAGGGAAVEGRPATECKLSQPFGIAFDPQDNMFICEETNRLLRVDAKTGILTIVTEARPKADLGNDGPVALTSFNAPHNLVADNQGNLFIADSFHF
ncbi:MAG: Serine/threonine-protein kinase PknD, partial [Verrucomicrobiota bacterium]